MNDANCTKGQPAHDKARQQEPTVTPIKRTFAEGNSEKDLSDSASSLSVPVFQKFTFVHLATAFRTFG